MRKKNYVRTTLLLLLSLLLGGPTLASAPEASLDFQIKYGILKQVVTCPQFLHQALVS